MNIANPFVSNVRLISPYMATGRRAHKEIRIDPEIVSSHRDRGEVIGRQVEECARYLIGRKLPLLTERYLAYNEHHPQTGVIARSRELDGVSRLATGKAVLLEAKLAPCARYLKMPGLNQLHTASCILKEIYPELLLRLVYIVPCEGYAPVLPNVPVVQMKDTTSPIGVIWIEPAAIEAAAKRLRLHLPSNWNSPKGRHGNIAFPEDWN